MARRPQQRTDCRLDAELLLQLTAQAGLQAFAGLDLAAGELPLAGMMPARWALTDEHPAVAYDHAGGNLDDRALAPAGRVDEADKPALYRGATVFAYHSRYEGFGLTPLEAMASGVPVVSSTGGSLPEVVGTAGYLLPPDDTRNFGAAIITVVVEPQVHDDLRARGLAQAQKFSWEKTARETAQAYADAAAKK